MQPNITDWVQAIATGIAALAIVFAIFTGKQKQARLKLAFNSVNGHFDKHENKDLVTLNFKLEGTLINQSLAPEGIAQIYLCINDPTKRYFTWHSVPPFEVQVGGKKSHKTQIYLEPYQAVGLQIILDKWTIGKDAVKPFETAVKNGNYFPWIIIFETSSGYFFNQHGKLINFQADQERWALESNMKADNPPTEAIKAGRRRIFKYQWSFFWKKFLRSSGLI